MNAMRLTTITLCGLLLLLGSCVGPSLQDDGGHLELDELEFGTEDAGTRTGGSSIGSGGLGALGPRDSARNSEVGVGIGGSGKEEKKGGLGGLLGGFGGVIGGLPGMNNLLGGKQEGGKNETGVMKPMNDWAKLIFNPFELVRAIGEFFKIPLDKFVEKIGSVVIFGAEAMLSPLVVSLKIIEKVFVPDACRLKFVCKIGGYLTMFKEPVLKFSPTFLEGSSQLKALTDGIVGRDCESAFQCGGGEPKLRKPFEQLRGQDKQLEAAASTYPAKQQVAKAASSTANNVAKPTKS